MRVEVSVVCPCYNAKPFIREALNSVLSQTFTDYEIIIIDDGSTDGSEEILKDYSNLDNVIVLRNLVNKGVSFSRNRGIQVARGKYIAFLDADDFWHPKKLEKQLNLIKNTDAVVCYTQSMTVDFAGNHIGCRVYRDKITVKMMRYRNFFTLSSCVIRKNEIIIPFRNVNHEDYDFWVNNIDVHTLIVGSDEILTFYRRHLQNMTVNQLQSFMWTVKSIYRFSNKNIFITIVNVMRNLISRFN